MAKLIFALIGLTILFEFPVWFFGIREVPWMQKVLFIILLNAFTNPLANLAIQDFQLNWWVVEGMVVLTEFGVAWLFWRQKPVKLFLLSLAANALSAGPGTWFFLWWAGAQA